MYDWLHLFNLYNVIQAQYIKAMYFPLTKYNKMCASSSSFFMYYAIHIKNQTKKNQICYKNKHKKFKFKYRNTRKLNKENHRS